MQGTFYFARLVEAS
uniref:Uncharacterized protein n=1 Tax=Anguilla anguilla TaxID=7936 RepID=A0A0E9VUV6_ANGAN